MRGRHRAEPGDKRARRYVPKASFKIDQKDESRDNQEGLVKHFRGLCVRLTLTNNIRWDNAHVARIHFALSGKHLRRGREEVD